jgi:uncharacterized membrane protein
MAEIGPVQMIAVAFGPNAEFEGKIIGELARLENEDTLRILDLLFVAKDAETGDLLALDHQGEDLGGIVGALLGFEFEGDEEPAPADDAGEHHAFGLSREQIEAMAASLDPGGAAAFVLIEHVWARELKRAVRDAGGVPIGEGFLTPELIASVGAELLAMAEALDEVEAETADASASS